MRIALFLILQLVFTFQLHARTGQVADRVMDLKEKGVHFQPVQLFTLVPRTAENEKLWAAAIKEGTVLQLDDQATRGIGGNAPSYATLELPTTNGIIILDLVRTQITTDDFKVNTASGAGAAYLPGVHYRGMVRGLAGSIAAISIFDGEVMGLINDGADEYVLGRLENDRSGKHVIYRTRDLRREQTFLCGTEAQEEPYRADQLAVGTADRTTRCVRYYWELNYDIFLNKGTVALATNFGTGLFNQSAILFDNDGIDVTLSELFIWDVASPFTGANSSEQLSNFRSTRTTFNGDLAHLLDLNNYGGRAYLNVICGGSSRHAYSGIYSTYSNVPTYSWSVNVVSHEQGHNLGSNHTHACVWNGNGTAIDGCGPTFNAIYSEGSCPVGPIPSSSVKGTIMSYCHLISGVGINLNNGFGPQPTAVMVNAVNAATCLAVCGNSCDAPGNLTATAITVNSATLSWAALGATTYTLRWKLVSGSTWTEVTGISGNSYALTGLSQGTAYEFQVLSICGATSSAYSTSRTFTTVLPCPDSLEPNNTTGTAALITLPTNISALIATNVDVDYYRFILTGTSTINLSLSNLAGDYDLRLLDNAGAQLAASALGGTSNEYINFPNAPAGTYYIHVFGYSGAFSATQCYSLNASAYAVQGCDRPVQLTISGITSYTGTASWSAVQGASGYDLRWTLSGGSTWTDELNISATTFVISGLQPNTAYDVQVRTRCEGGTLGGTSSAYSPSTTFTTIDGPCGNFGIYASVILDGPYSVSTQLMADSLRVNGLVPLEEPYTALGYPVGWAATTTPAVLAVTGPTAVVDWVILEARSTAAPYEVVERQAGLLLRNGSIVDASGSGRVGFCSPMVSYRFAVRHRNHLGAMTANSFTTSPLGSAVNFTISATSTYGTNARKTLSDGSMALWSGNATGNMPGGTLGQVEVKYTGSINDRDRILLAIGGTVASNVVSGYLLEDCNLDGRVKYTGANNDRDIILLNIGGSVATNIVVEQLP